MKYKVGDRVKIVAKRTGEGWNSDGEMDKWLGKTMTVTGITMNCYKMAEDVGDRTPYGGWCWWEHMIEGLANDTQKIVITTDGKTTLARLYDGKNVVKSAEAKRSSEDAFDFMTGAKIALERLNAPEEKFVQRLECRNEFYGKIGEKTDIKDAIGRPLRIGDTVELYDRDLKYVAEEAIVFDNDNGEAFVMGIRIDCKTNGAITGGWKIIKKRSFDEVADREKVGSITYIKTK
jgi:hypothetical protein